MDINNPAIAGTLESSDVQVILEPGASGIELELASSVQNQYGRQIQNLVLATLNDLGVKNAKVSITDRGALECTIRARVETAYFRSIGKTENIPWGVLS